MFVFDVISDEYKNLHVCTGKRVDYWTEPSITFHFLHGFEHGLQLMCVLLSDQISGKSRLHSIINDVTTTEYYTFHVDAVIDQITEGYQMKLFNRHIMFLAPNEFHIVSWKSANSWRKWTQISRWPYDFKLTFEPTAFYCKVTKYLKSGSGTCSVALLPLSHSTKRTCWL